MSLSDSSYATLTLLFAAPPAKGWFLVCGRHGTNSDMAESVLDFWRESVLETERNTGSVSGTDAATVGLSELGGVVVLLVVSRTVFRRGASDAMTLLGTNKCTKIRNRNRIR